MVVTIWRIWGRMDLCLRRRKCQLSLNRTWMDNFRSLTTLSQAHRIYQEKLTIILLLLIRRRSLLAIFCPRERLLMSIFSQNSMLIPYSLSFISKRTHMSNISLPKNSRLEHGDSTKSSKLGSRDSKLQRSLKKIMNKEPMPSLILNQMVGFREGKLISFSSSNILKMKNFEGSICGWNTKRWQHQHISEIFFEI